MAISGSGTQADPWVVTTYAELVTKAVSDGYIKIGNDINITDEYPDGDMPTLSMGDCDIDGNSKTISNWYRNTSGYCIANTDGTDTLCNIHDLTLKNIYIDGSATAFCNRAEDNNSRPFFENCNFSGVMRKSFTIGSTSTLRFKSCSLNINLGSNRPFDTDYYGHSAGGFFDNCFVRFKSDYSGTFFFDYSVNPNAKDSYFEMTLPNVDRMDNYGHGFDNCVLDIISDNAFYIGGGNHGVSIVNTTHAPNAVPDGTNVKGVSDTNWLNVSYLSSIGFNAG